MCTRDNPLLGHLPQCGQVICISISANQHNLGIGAKLLGLPLPLSKGTVQHFWLANVKADEHRVWIREMLGTRRYHSRKNPKCPPCWTQCTLVYLKAYLQCSLQPSRNMTPPVDVLANTCNSVILPHVMSLTTTILQLPLCPSMVPAMCHAPSATLLPGLSYSHSGWPHWYLMGLWSSHPGWRTPSAPPPAPLKILVAHWLT